MDINEIQKLIEELGAAVIVGEDGPKMIAMSYETYRAAVSGRRNGRPDAEVAHGLWHSVPEVIEEKRDFVSTKGSFGTGTGDQELIEKLNQDIAILKEEIKKKELGEL